MARILQVCNSDFYLNRFLLPLILELTARGHAVECAFEGSALLWAVALQAALRRHGLPVRGLRAESVDDVDAARTVALRLLDVKRVPVADLLPAGWGQRPVWLHVGARAGVDEGSRRQLRLDVEDFAVGRQRLPARMLRLLLDPAAVGLLRWPLPAHVDSVTIEPGRVVIRGAS